MTARTHTEACRSIMEEEVGKHKEGREWLDRSRKRMEGHTEAKRRRTTPEGDLSGKEYFQVLGQEVRTGCTGRGPESSGGQPDVTAPAVEIPEETEDPKEGQAGAEQEETVEDAPRTKETRGRNGEEEAQAEAKRVRFEEKTGEKRQERVDEVDQAEGGHTKRTKMDLSRVEETNELDIMEIYSEPRVAA